MRHHNANRKFGRGRDQRIALIRSLAVSLVDKEKIKTTEIKAKELRPFVEKAVTRAKANSVASRRILEKTLNSRVAASKLVKDIAPKYAERKGGYLRIQKAGFRKNDGTKMAYIEFI